LGHTREQFSTPTLGFPSAVGSRGVSIALLQRPRAYARLSPPILKRRLGDRMFEPTSMIITTTLLGLVGLSFAALTYVQILRQPAGDGMMIEISNAIHDGAMVFLKREYMILSIFILVVATAIFFGLPEGNKTALAFIFGALCSLLAGFFGMKAATRANVRTAEAARRSGQRAALMVAFSGGAVMGMSVASLGLIGTGLLLYVYTQLLGLSPAKTAMVISGFAMGASSIALFARVGGGIYTKTADVGDPRRRSAQPGNDRRQRGG
jgi:K(+)-stimulated pyrophosphate-energized sodium pump